MMRDGSILGERRGERERDMSGKMKRNVTGRFNCIFLPVAGH